jgi:polysaccharide deacetylase family protein (PEP-CTERM system associated)
LTQSQPVTNALTIDFEDWYQGLEIPPSDWDGFEERIQLAGRRILSVLADFDAKATFFVLGHVADSHPDLVREIAAQGHEIGTHGQSHTLVYQLTPEAFREEIRHSVGVLEALTGQEISGFRAPFFSITKDSLWALDILIEEGLTYDSSIFPVTNYRYGIPGAEPWPYRIDRPGGAIAEFPVTTWSWAGKRIPVAGGAYFRIYPYALTRTAFRSINKQGRPAVFYLHPWEVDPNHPRIPLPRRIGILHYWNLAATEARLRRLLADFRFAPMREVLPAAVGER